MRCLVAVSLALAGGALAAPPPSPASPVWADWVGDWQAKLKWTSCTAEGNASATLPVDAVDGVVAIDLAGVGDGLGAMSLVEDNGGWLAQQGDVTVHVAKAKDALELAVDLDSGCQMRATLHRPSVGIAACDQLEAWARIEARCTRLVKPPLEDTARLVHQRSTWAKARGDARSKLGAQCEARATKVAAELVDAGCAPNPDPAIGLRGAECQALRATSSRMARCSNLPSDLKNVLAREAQDLVDGAQTADGATLAVVEAQCRQLRETIAQTAQQVGCPP